MNDSGWGQIRHLFTYVLYALPGWLLASISYARRMNLQHHRPVFTTRTLLYALLSFLFFYILEKIRIHTAPDRDSAPGLLSTAMPLSLNLIPFLTVSWFWTGADMVARMKWAFALSLIVYLIWGWHSHLRTYLTRMVRFLLPHNFFLVLYLAYLIIGSGLLFPTIGFTGDEPHYLIITQSLWEDHDIDLANNYLSGAYGLISRYPLEIHAWQGKGPGLHLYSIHMPGLSLLMTPFYAFAKLYPPVFAALIRLGMILIGLWSIRGFYLLIRAITPEPEDAVLATLVFGLTVPTIFYVYHLYPEIVALGIITRAFRVWLDSELFRPASAIRHGLMVGAMVFLGTKYLAIISIWAALTLFRLRKLSNARKFFTYFVLALSPGVLGYLVYLYLCYGNLNPMAVYAGGARSQEAVANLLNILTNLRLWNDRISTFFSYFIDQRDGILFYSPVYFFGLLGWVHWYRHDRERSLYALALFLAHVSLYSFFTHRGGFAPPARPLMPVIWVLALGWPAWWRSQHRPWVRTIASMSILYSLLIPWYMATAPHSIYQSTNHDVTTRASLTFERLSNLYIYLPELLPSYVKSFKGPWWPNYFWGFFFLGIAILYLVRLSRHRIEMLRFTGSRSLSPAVVMMTTALGFSLLTSALPKVSPKKGDALDFPSIHASLAYQPTRCEPFKMTDNEVYFECKSRPGTWFIIKSKQALSLDADLRCTTPGRKLDYWMYWFDIRVKPVEIRANLKKYFAYHWPYWSEFRDHRWGFIRLFPEWKDRSFCRDIHLRLRLRLPPGSHNF